MNPPIPSMTTRPYGEDHMLPAWVSCAEYSITNKELRKKFKTETGVDLYTVTDRPEDKTSAYVKWLDWFTVNVWGEEEGCLHEKEVKKYA